MSNFKKDLSEHYNFFSKCSEYFLLKHKLSNLGNSRFASALDIYYLNELEKIYNTNLNVINKSSNLIVFLKNRKEFKRLNDAQLKNNEKGIKKRR